MSLFSFGTGIMTTTKRVEHFLSFDGVDDYVQARDASVFDVTTGDFDVEVEYRSTDVSGNPVRLLDKRGTGARTGNFPGWQLSANLGTFQNSIVQTGTNAYIGTPPTDFENVNYTADGLWHTAQFTWDNTTGTGTLTLDGSQTEQQTNGSMVGQSISNGVKFTVGGSSNNDGQYFLGDIKSFRVGTETFLLNEGTGTTVTGSEGTVLDIYGATWGSEIK